MYLALLFIVGVILYSRYMYISCKYDKGMVEELYRNHKEITKEEYVKVYEYYFNHKKDRDKIDFTNFK